MVLEVQKEVSAPQPGQYQGHDQGSGKARASFDFLLKFKMLEVTNPHDHRKQIS